MTKTAMIIVGHNNKHDIKNVKRKSIDPISCEI